VIADIRRVYYYAVVVVAAVVVAYRRREMHPRRTGLRVSVRIAPRRGLSPSTTDRRINEVILLFFQKIVSRIIHTSCVRIYIYIPRASGPRTYAGVVYNIIIYIIEWLGIRTRTRETRLVRTRRDPTDLRAQTYNIKYYTKYVYVVYTAYGIRPRSTRAAMRPPRLGAVIFIRILCIRAGKICTRIYARPIGKLSTAFYTRVLLLLLLLLLKKNK